MQCYLLKNKSAGFEPDASVRDLYVRGLDPLNGMANCPGYHGYERVWEHINHKDLGFFLFYLFFFLQKRHRTAQSSFMKLIYGVQYQCV